MRGVRGFALIELMVVVAIIGILSAIAGQAYHGYTVRGAERACLLETRAYATVLVIWIGDNKVLADIPAEPMGACTGFTGGGAGAVLGAPLVGTPKAPGVAKQSVQLN